MIRLARVALPAILVVAMGASRGSAQEARPLKLVDAPTAEVIGRGVYDLNVLFYPDGGLLAGIEIGLQPRFQLGFNYGGLRMVGAGTPDWNPRVEFNARYQVAAESFALPALAIGFDSQGFGYWDDAYQRYQVKSKGFYAVVSRNWSMMGRLGLHGGLNYSVEGNDRRRRNPDGFAGIEKSLGPDVDLMGEYDATFNDGSDQVKHGRLNFAVRWTYAEHLHLQVDCRNLLRSEEVQYAGGTRIESRDWSRGLQLSYRESF